MDRSGKKEGLLERTAEVFDLPGDVVAGLPRIELTGSRELRMENHKGILSYGGEEIRSQIQAVYDAGYEEWILWSASNKYHYGALESEEEQQN